MHPGALHLAHVKHSHGPEGSPLAPQVNLSPRQHPAGAAGERPQSREQHQREAGHISSGDAKIGYVVDISAEEAEAANQRISSCTSTELGLSPGATSWIIPAEQDLGLLFFRQIFSELRKRSQAKKPRCMHCGNVYMDDAKFCRHCGREREASQSGTADDDDVPIEAFQRAFERLFYILGYDEPFDASVFDDNGNGFVGWSEFSSVFKQMKKKIRLSIPERIYLTFDNPDSSYLAQFVSAFVLLTIVVSSVCFILSTTPDFQKAPVNNEKPDPKDILGVAETTCLIIFVVEYVIRLFTCWAVQVEVTNRARLLELVTGYEVINMSTPGRRLLYFIIAPANIIDLVAILPGMIGLITYLADPDGEQSENGVFVVLRLVRLTRIFRAFKNPKYRQPVVVIAQTIANSTKALYVLAFNLLLGILISGSLMWLCEKGKWDASTRTYNRKVGEAYNATSDSWYDLEERSPFEDIPKAFWWAVVTATTVGYGDMYPTTSLGYAVAAATMLYSLVILALPVGVIGSNFSQAWEDYELKRMLQTQETEKDKIFITSAIQRIDPFAMSRLILIEVWNERFPSGDGSPPREGIDFRPDPAEFMGEVHYKIDIPADEQVKSGDITLPLGTNDPDMPKRDVQGTITFRYDWNPSPVPADVEEASPSGHDPPFRRLSSAFPTLKGSLKFTLVGADGLMNLNWLRGRKGWSNPYCVVYCYPNSPDVGESLKPHCWRSPTCAGTCSPKWMECNSDISFCWLRIRPKTAASLPGGKDEDDAGAKAPAPQAVPPGPVAMATSAAKPSSEDDMVALLRGLSQSVHDLRQEVGVLNARVGSGRTDSKPNDSTKIYPEPEATTAAMRMAGSPWMEPRADTKADTGVTSPVLPNTIPDTSLTSETKRG